MVTTKPDSNPTILDDVLKMIDHCNSLSFVYPYVVYVLDDDGSTRQFQITEDNTITEEVIDIL